MTNNFEQAYDPYEEMKQFYSLDDPTEADQFRFVEAMEYLIRTVYDLMTLEETNANVTFIYDNEEYSIDIFPDEGEIVYQFGSRWFHGADDFLEKARVNQKRLTTVYHQIRDIKVRK